MPLAAGELNRRVSLERKAAMEDGHGGQSDAVWTEIAKPWVKATPFVTKGDQSEIMQAGALAQYQRWKIEMRPRDVTPADRLIMGAEVLNIRSVIDPEGDRDRLTLMCDNLATA